MSRIDDLLERSADEVRQTVARMPQREVTTVAQTSTRKTYLSAAVAVAGVIVVVLLGWALFGFGGAEEVDPIEPTPTPVDPDAAPLPAAPARLEAGTFATDVLGPTFSFSVDGSAPDTWYLQVAAPGEVAISHPLSNGPGDRDIWFGYPDALSDPENPYTAGWPIDDLDGWLEANADVVLDGPTDSIVGGRPAVSVTLAGARPCRDPEGPDDVPCPTFAFDDDQGALWLVEGARFEIWWIEDVDGSPFVIAAGDSTWTDEFRADVDAVVASWASDQSEAPATAPDLGGDPDLLAERARAAAAEVGDPDLEAAIEDAIDSGLLDFSGPPDEAIVNLLEFSWLLDTTNPEPEMLDLFLAPDGGARTSYETSNTFGAGGLIVVTGEGAYEVESAEASAVADYSPSIAATSPDDAVVVEVVVSIPEIEVRAADGSVVRTVPERVSQPLAYVLVPGDTGWLIWLELA